MALEKEISSLFGPLHLTAIDWNNTIHRRSVAASLVKGVYTLERDRQKKRHGAQALAPPWWNFFHFQLNKLLIDETNTIFAAIYQYKSQALTHNNSSHIAPKYVVAFRGALDIPQDVELNLQLMIFNKLHENSRTYCSMEEIKNLVSDFGAENIWLAGHSLGSAMAMLAGKKMAKVNYNLETYLFNPPFLSLPIEWINDQNLKDGIRFTSSVIKAGLAVVVKDCEKRSKDESFVELSSWVPYLFVNPDDPICSEYIGYFEQRKKMEKIGFGKIERVATKNSIRSLVLGALGNDSEPLPLLPSAYLTVNLSRSWDFIEAHRIHQWWRPDIHCQSNLYQFR